MDLVTASKHFQLDTKVQTLWGQVIETNHSNTKPFCADTPLSKHYHSCKGQYLKDALLGHNFHNWITHIEIVVPEYPP